MRLNKHILFPVVLLISSAGCADLGLPTLPSPGVPFVHKIDIQQGNVVTQDMVAQLRLGMNKKKVRFVMGTPIIKDTFHASRWDYIYTFKEGGGATQRHLVTAIFNDDGKLINLDGNIKAALGRLEVDMHQDTSVEVPEDYIKGIFAKLKESMPFTGGDEPEPEAEVAEGESEADDKLDDELADEESKVLSEAEKNAVTVPAGAPPKKKKGFFTRIVNAIGIGAEDEDEEPDEVGASYDPEDPKYRDPTDPEYK